ncbi:MAG: metallophosphoesterase family protein [Gemmatimonas sp.]
MLGWFRQKRAVEAAPEATAPEGTRIYAVGDIHGRADLLADLHRMIVADAATAPARKVVVYLGDYVDRGLQSRQVIDMLANEPLAGFERVHLKGNHEEAMLEFLADPRIGPSWTQFGGAATLMSYGAGRVTPASPESAFAAAQAALAENLPPAHLAFLRDLALCREEGGYWFVHAGARPGVPLDEQSPEDMLWIRDEFLLSREAFGRVVVHGHTITDEPEVCVNRIGIDTGAFATGRLTCLVLEGAERRFLFT